MGRHGEHDEQSASKVLQCGIANGLGLDSISEHPSPKKRKQFQTVQIQTFLKRYFLLTDLDMLHFQYEYMEIERVAGALSTQLWGDHFRHKQLRYINLKELPMLLLCAPNRRTQNCTPARCKVPLNSTGCCYAQIWWLSVADSNTLYQLNHVRYIQ